MDKILITGGTGFIGMNLIPFLSQCGFELAVLSRNPKAAKFSNVDFYHWDIKKREIETEAVKNVDFIINLAGANIGAKKWTGERKNLILNSRIQSADFLYDNISKYSSKLKCIISSSAVGYYGTFNSEKILTEDSPNGDDFLAEVCRQWEMSARRFENLGARTVVLRKAAVLGKSGGMVERMAALAKFGLNTAVGSGNQFVPWISMQDLLRLYFFVLEHKSMTGAFNAVSGAHTRMNEFAKALSKSLERPILTPKAPAFVIKLMYGEMADILLKGSRVSNGKLKKEGFVFRDNHIIKVLKDIMSEG